MSIITEEKRNYICETDRARSFLEEQLTKRGVEFIPSATNFITAKLADYVDIDAFKIYARTHGFLMRRPFREEKLKDWVRVGLLDEKGMRDFVALLDRFLETGGNV